MLFCVKFTQKFCKYENVFYICVKITQTTKPIFIMNIMNYLGFKKKGAEQQNEERNVKFQKNEFHFSDKYAREEGETRIYNLIILDESGSMSPIRMQALSGANDTLQSIRVAQQECPDDHQMISFVTFDSGEARQDVRKIIDTEKIENVKDITLDQYQPRGCTPLYDAMGLSITALRELVKEGDHVLVTVITDGFENSSRKYSAEMIKELVESLTAHGWVFTYIGANQDSKQTASGLGIRCTMDFEVSSVGSTMMWERMNSSQREYFKKVRRHKMTGENINYTDDFFAEEQARSRITPDRITELQEGQIFVFGSNVNGFHDGGAAHYALQNFGAVYGQCSGLQGRSYAIPTVGCSISTVADEVDKFIRFADANPEHTFLVTRIGCGSAGYSDEDIAPLFARAYSLPNVYLPGEFWKILTYKYR